VVRERSARAEDGREERVRYQARGPGSQRSENRLTGREDVQFGTGDVVEGGKVGLEVLGEDLLRDVVEPVGKLEGAALIEFAVGCCQYTE
jgi:hypothetical protein